MNTEPGTAWQQPEASQHIEQPDAAHQPSPIPVTLVSWSEFLLPVAYATMESCALAVLLIGLASIHLFGWEQPFMPLWGPLLLLVSNTWLSQILKMQPFPGDNYARRRGFRINIGIIIAIQVLLTLVVVWGSLYAGHYALWNPAWISSVITDLLTFHLPAFTILCIVVVANLLYYYGMNITRRVKEPGDVTRIIFSRGALFGVVILLQAAKNTSDQLELLILFPLFLASGLSTRAIASTVMLRNYHLTGLQGSKRAQDRLLFMILLPTCLSIIILALLLGFTVNPQMLSVLLQLLSPIGLLYLALTSVIAAIAVVIMAPFLWFLQAVGFKWHFAKLPARPASVSPGSHPAHPVTHSTVSAAVTNAATASGILLLIIIIILLVVASILLSRKLKRKQVRIEGESRETLWSWSLFWSQVQAFLSYLWHRLLYREVTIVSSPAVEPVVVEGEMTEKERDIRAIYRAFLRWSAAQGQHRHNSETPFEFHQRFNKNMAALQPESSIITGIYASTRYGKEPPTQEDFLRMQQSWQAMQQKAVDGSES